MGTLRHETAASAPRRGGSGPALAQSLGAWAGTPPPYALPRPCSGAGPRGPLPAGAASPTPWATATCSPAASAAAAAPTVADDASAGRCRDRPPCAKRPSGPRPAPAIETPSPASPAPAPPPGRPGRAASRPEGDPAGTRAPAAPRDEAPRTATQSVAGAGRAWVAGYARYHSRRHRPSTKVMARIGRTPPPPPPPPLACDRRTSSSPAAWPPFAAWPAPARSCAGCAPAAAPAPPSAAARDATVAHVSGERRGGRKSHAHAARTRFSACVAR